MTAKEILLATFYILAFGLSVLTGVTTGFTGNSHTPPLPFGIEIICLPLGITVCLIDLVKKSKANTASKLRIHAFGLIANGLIVLYILILY